VRLSDLFELDPEKFGADNPRDAVRMARLCAKGARLEAAGKSTRAVEAELDRIQQESRERTAARNAQRRTARTRP
jgi:D-serine deaminase-like pyridoxal phosphate-dependent protein